MFSLARGLRGDMIAICKYSRDINTRKGEELLKLKNNVGRRTNVYKLT